MKITKIYAENYKSIIKWELTFADNKTVIVGKNNSWKSNLLSILNVFFSGKYPTYWNFEKEDFYDKTKPIYLEINFDNGAKLWLQVTYDSQNDKVNKPDWKNNSWIENTKSETLQKLCSCVYIPSDRNIDQHLRNNTYSRYWKLLQLIFEYKKTTTAYQNVVTKLWEIQEEFSKILPTEDVSKISKTLTYINKVSFWLSEWWKPEDLLKKVEVLVDDWCGNMSLSKFWTGTQSTVILWLLELYLTVSHYDWWSQCKILIIDEPENYLHPHAKRLLDNVLHQISLNENTQVIYSTHSSELVSNFDNSDFKLSDVRLIYKEGKETKVRTIEDDKSITYELNSNNSEIFFANKIILVEWLTEKIAIPRIFLEYKWNKENCGVYGTTIDQELNGIEDATEKEEYKKNAIKKFFDINLHNISIINVWSKDSLPKWFKFCSQIVWKENVIVIQDKDIHLEEWKQINTDSIEKVIKEVYSIEELEDLEKYNRFILEWEFEYQYRKEIIQEIITNKITEYFTEKSEPEKIKASSDGFQTELKTIYTEANTNKFSKAFERLINNYYQWYSKPAIARLLIDQLIEKQWFNDHLIEIMSKIMQKINLSN